MSDYSEYTKQRDIAQKRLKRLAAAGVKVDYKVPTVKEIRAGKANLEESFRQLQSFLGSEMNLQARREASRVHLSKEEAAERRREYQRQYRRQRVARAYEREEYPNKYQGYVRGINTVRKKLAGIGINIDIKPKDLPAFFAYADYRLEMGGHQKQYIFDLVVQDFQKYLNKGYKPEQIISDFERFVSDQKGLSLSAETMQGYTFREFNSLWNEYNIARLS